MSKRSSYNNFSLARVVGRSVNWSGSISRRAVHVTSLAPDAAWIAAPDASITTHGRFNYARPRNSVVAHAQLKMTGFCSSDVNQRLHTDTAESLGCLLGYDHIIG